MKLIREHINEKFKEDSDPINDMRIGIKHQIEEWLKKYSIFVRNPIINDDYTIDAYRIDFFDKGIGNLPEYIQFNQAEPGNVNFYGCKLTTLRGLPKIMDGDLSLGNNKLKNLKYLPKGNIGHIMIFENNLISLEGLPEQINGNLNCANNKNLKTLKGLSQVISKNFICYFTGMSDEYIFNYLKDNNIRIYGKKIITKEDAIREQYIYV